MTETERISRMIEEHAGMSDGERAAAAVRDWVSSGRRRQMLEGQRYYENRCDILGRKRWVSC